MKLTVGRGVGPNGFALPTILLVSTVMLIILVASVAAVAVSRVSLDSQYYNLLAKQAAQSGMARAKECLSTSGYEPQWSTASVGKNLRPDSDCSGTTMSGGGVSAYVVGDGTGPSINVRTTYSVDAPSGTGVGSTMQVVGTTELVRTSSPHSVWRTYQQSLYYHIEEPSAVACPEGFVPVPGDSRFGTIDFCISKYEAKNVGGKAVSQASGTPYISISQTDAIAAAANACMGCHLTSEAEWLTVAHNAVNVATNWSDGSVGSGFLYNGHTDNSPASSLEASGDDTDGYYGTGNTAGSNQRRTMILNNGQTVWDMAGNVTEWTSGKTTGGQPGASGFAWREWNAVGGTGSLSPNPFPSFGTPAASSWTSTERLGRIYSNTSDATQRGFLRGAAYNYDTSFAGSAGIFMTYLGLTPSQTATNIGFRIAFQPVDASSCSPGFLAVQGDSTYGTNAFCVAKYEAKNNGSGTAISQAGGTPWVNITQTSAMTVAANACTRCHLITEAEWLTVARNLMNVDSNWTGGSVNNGQLYIGHSDYGGSVPNGGQVASADDNDGYLNTGHVSPNKYRRTLTLNTGQVIWDFAGNVKEWTSGQVSGGQPGNSGWSWRGWNGLPVHGTLSPDPFPSFAAPGADAWSGVGQIFSNSSEAGLRGITRGGGSGHYDASGIFTADFNTSPSGADGGIGFRLVYPLN